jgi:hypothetical protein
MTDDTVFWVIFTFGTSWVTRETFWDVFEFKVSDWTWTSVGWSSQIDTRGTVGGTSFTSSTSIVTVITLIVSINILPDVTVTDWFRTWDSVSFTFPTVISMIITS